MALLLLLPIMLLAGGLREAAARTVPVEFLYPPYNLTYMHYIDTNGVFLRSPNATFSAAVFNSGSSDSSGADESQLTMSRYFFSVLHDRSRTPVWAAAAGATIVQSIILSLNASGLYISDPAGLSGPSWSTPRLAAPVAALRLLDTGQLALIDADNATLWSTFDAPTDTLLQGQLLPVAVPLTATASDQDLSPGAYRLLLTPADALLQWASSDGGGDFVTYWALSSDPASVQDSNRAVRSMMVNASGVFLLADGGGTVFSLRFASPPPAPATKMLLKVDSSGRLRALSTAYSPTAARATLPAVWAAPASDCDLPLPCGALGLCTPGNNGSSCMCPDAFTTHTTGGCSPADGSALPALPDTCLAGNSKPSSSSAAAHSYTRLGDGIGYFASKFALPTTAGDALPACRDLCSANCSCVGFVYKNSSKSCLLVHNQIGSVFRGAGNSAAATVAFVKTVPPAPSRGGQGGDGGSGSSSSLSTITIIFGIVLPAVAAVFITFLLYVLGVHWLKNRHGGAGKAKRKQHGHGGSSWFMLHMMPSLSSSRASSNAPSEKGGGDSEDEGDDEVLIPGLPTRFTFADLEAATNGFKWQIGSGGFGSVYRGELPDRTTVAVKRMNNLGMQGRREFLTEIAVIGNVHHVNLVKLRGFCAEGARQQLLVYEYMSRGSLDQSLFPRAGAGAASKAVLEWAERLGVCVGAARGLAYLHAGCDRKILHCDVKPENILLDERGGVKIADFGLAKLMSPEQSGLFTTMRGTRGYLAPEWLMNAPITDKADVYSFGMVLLELVRGRKNSKQDDDDHHDAATTGTNSSSTTSGTTGEATEARRSSYFPALALELHEEGRYMELVDRRLEGRADAAEVERVVRVALCCLHEEASSRPAMTAVAGMLDGSMDVCVPRTEQLAYLRMYGRGLVDVRPGGWKGKWKGSEMTAGSSSWSPPSCVSAQQLSAPR
ncbi:G-type lectin S-receptor-like serine/threonine-protein kinase [Hordeum vulgare]|nr:G-type lectin S-receptor-like serine/threonine-protein kinase [Hordeum vulgare]